MHRSGRIGAVLAAALAAAFAFQCASAAAASPRATAAPPYNARVVFLAAHGYLPKKVDPMVMPWRRDGTSRVAQIRTKRLRVYGQPRAKRPIAVLRNPNWRGTRLVLLVKRRRPGWLNVYLPRRPNQSRGWIRRGDARVLSNDYRVVVRIESHRLEVWRRRRLVTRQTIAIGRLQWPTPHGVFFVAELLKPSRPNGAYGPYSFGLSAHSDVLKRFGSGIGRVGMHGTNTPWLLGREISHGCIRMRNETVRKLAKVLPLGTPVVIRS